MIQKLLWFIRSPKFLVFTFVFFLIQGVFFAIAINPSDIHINSDGTVARGGGVVPDGNRHIGAIYYFAGRPLLDGPFVTDMTDGELWMGDLERFPSYFYYYLTSFFVRIPMAFDAPDIVNVMVIRLVGLLYGVLALAVFYRIVRLLTTNRVVINLSVLALAITGSFAWLSPAENYDVLALLFFFLFMQAALKLFSKKDPGQLYWMLIWLSLGSITKYTYLPFMGLFGLVAVWLYVRAGGGVRASLEQVKKKLRLFIKNSRPAVVATMTLLLIIVGVLFVERIGVNLVAYRSIEPDCAVVHSQSACMNFGVYERNYNRSQQVSAASTDYIFDPVNFTSIWLYKYYTSMYAYVGHIGIKDFSIVMYMGLWTVLAGLVAMFILIKRRRQNILTSTPLRYIAFVTATLIILQYAYNAVSFAKYGGVAYATQGRYLLSAVGFVYLLCLIIAVTFLRVVGKKYQGKARTFLVVLGLIALLTNSALVVFFLHATTPNWFSWS